MKTSWMLAGALLWAGQAGAAPRDTVRPEQVRAELGFLAGDALRGRGSATHDEAVAAAYVASEFEGMGLQPAPGRQGYVEAVRVATVRQTGPATLTVGGVVQPSPTPLFASGEAVSGSLAVTDAADPKAFPARPVLLATARGLTLRALSGNVAAKGIRLLILRESPALRAVWNQRGGPMLPRRLADDPAGEASPTVVMLPDAAVDALAAQAGRAVSFALPTAVETGVTSNAMAWLPGRDPAAGVILLSAHLDHLGVRPDGVVMPGANDDASGTVAVIELARALSTGRRPKRGILFVAYGSEERGGFGSRWFAAHPPVPLDRIAANIEFEMIGAQDPKLPAGALMMTGYERSNLGAELKRHGALVAQDPYPEQNFFARSDNYELALAGVVAHTLSGWATLPTYHTPQDTIAAIDFGYMTRAIRSLVGPMRRLANGRFVPRWNPGGRPTG